MPEIDPDRAPLDPDVLERDARRAGVSPEAPPLTEAQHPPTDGSARIEADVTLLPPG